MTHTSSGKLLMGAILWRDRHSPLASGDTDAWLLKLDSEGNMMWQKTYGGTGFDSAYSVQQTSPDGGYIVAGQTYSSGAGDQDIWLLKLTANGDIVWQKTYGGGAWDFANFVQQTSDGGYIVAGGTSSFGAGEQGCMAAEA